jgi:hypothetical protein
VTIVSILEVIIGILYMIVGLYAAAFTNQMGEIYGNLGEVIIGLFILLSLVSFTLTWGFMTGQRWARRVCKILSVVGVLGGIILLPSGLISLILNILVIYYLTRPDLIKWFSGMTPTPTKHSLPQEKLSVRR